MSVRWQHFFNWANLTRACVQVRQQDRRGLGGSCCYTHLTSWSEFIQCPHGLRYLLLLFAFCEKRERKVTEMRVVVREGAGNALKHLAKPEPLKKSWLWRNRLLSCSSSKPGNCEKNGCGYRIRCEICMRAGRLSLYDGESGSPCYTRGKQHQDGLWLKDGEIPLWEHCLVEYVGNRAQFPMEQTGVFGICLVNQVHEAVRIEMSTADCAINVRVPSSSIGESCASGWVGGRAWSRSMTLQIQN